MLSDHISLKSESNLSGGILISDCNYGEGENQWAEWNRRQMAVSRFPRLERIRRVMPDCRSDLWRSVRTMLCRSSDSIRNDGERSQYQSLSENSQVQFRMIVIGVARIGLLEDEVLRWTVSLRSIISLEVVKVKQRSGLANMVRSRRFCRKKSMRFKERVAGVSLRRKSVSKQIRNRVPTRIPVGQRLPGRMVRGKRIGERKRQNLVARKKQQLRNYFNYYQVFIRIKARHQSVHTGSQDLDIDESSVDFGDEGKQNNDETSNGKRVMNSVHSNNVYVAEVCNESTAFQCYDFLSQLIFVEMKKYR